MSLKTKKKIANYVKILLQLSREKGKLSKERVFAVLEALKTKPVKEQKKVLKAYAVLIEKELSDTQALFQHSGELSAETVKNITRKLETHYNRQLEAVVDANTKLIAGVRIKIGDDVWEDSLSLRLQTLSKSIKA